MGTKTAILVVDDDAVMLATLSRLLANRGYAVASAGTGEEALAVLTRQPVDLILTDLQLPGIDGLELLRQIKDSSPQTPVVMITGHADTENVIRALRGGVSDFMTKPFQTDELMGIIEREIERARQVAAVAKSAPAAPQVLGRQLSPDQLDAIDHTVAELRFETSARCVLVVEGTGHIISVKGVIEDINVAALAALVAGDFAATKGIASLLGESGAFRLDYHEGQSYSIYSAHLTAEAFLLVVFGRDIKSGLVLYETRRALPELQAILAQPAYEVAEEIVLTEPAQNQESEATVVFSLDQVLATDLLSEDALSRLDEQIQDLWN